MVKLILSPHLLFNDLKIESIKLIKKKHILLFFENDFGQKIKGIAFNVKDSILGDYLEKFNQYNLLIACTVSFR